MVDRPASAMEETNELRGIKLKKKKLEVREEAKEERKERRKKKDCLGEGL